MRKGKVFYSIYFACIVLFFAGMAWVMVWLYGWLKDYEASQPTAKCDEIFSELFTNPDWGKIYDLSGTEDTIFEGRDAYISYMTDKVKDTALTCMETSAGLSGDKKYFVKLGEERLLCFTLTRSENQDNGRTEWSLGEIILELDRGHSVRVWKEQGHTVYLNGVELDDDYTVQRVATLAESYLPDGIHGQHLEMQSVEGLLLPPEITIVDENGVEKEVVYDADTDIYAEQMENRSITAEEEQIALTVAEGYCKYMIGTAGNLSSYFDTGTDIYQTIRHNESWMQSYTDYAFEGETVSGYYRYTENLFSARVTLSLNVTRKNGTIKEYALDSSFLFEKQADGSYLAVEMSNVDMQKPVTEVRLTYQNGETTIKTEFVKTDSRRISTPSVEVPSGQVFCGWAKEVTDGTGRKTRVLLFVPGEDGEVALPDGYELEPLTLYPVFEENSTEEKGE